MNTLKFLPIFLILNYVNIYSQNVEFPTWGQFSEYEKNMTVYEKDTTANAVILQEVGYSYTEDGGDYNIVTDFHIRIKILKKEGFENGNIKIRLYKEETLSKLKAITTNFVNGVPIRKEVLKSNIFNEKINENWNSVSFAFPDLQEGSILEYSYTKKSPYYYKFGGGWTFQSDIPTLKSTFYAKIPGFWNYNISTVNIKSQNVKQNILVKKCLQIGGATADCMFLELEETDVPAFIEEDFSLSKYNFLKKINFELKTITRTDGITIQYNKTWADTDKRIFADERFGKEYGITSVIKKQLPSNVINEPDELERAKKVYEFIKKYYHWNGEYELWKDFNAKKSFEAKTGSVTEINSMLINALLASGIQSDIALLSTRENGLVTKLFPVVSDFNYLIAHIKIGDKDYFLDATQPLLPFNMLPYECLNHDIRVFPKKADSYWVDYDPEPNNETNINALAHISPDGEITSQVRVSSSGYRALQKREAIDEEGEEKYIESKLNEHEDIELDNYKIENVENLAQNLIETFEMKTSSVLSTTDKLYISPYVYKEFEENPFKQVDRQYPIDFAYPRKYNFTIVMMLPEGYKAMDSGKNRKSYLPDLGGNLINIIEIQDNKITVKLSLTISDTVFNPEDYKIIKMVFAELIKFQEEKLILTKI